MGGVIFFILKLTRDAVQPQNKTDFCSDHNKAISHLGLLYGIFMMVCYIQHNLFPFHQQVRLRASLVGHFEKSTCLVRAAFTSLQRAYFNSQLTTGSYFASCWKVSRCLWWLASLNSVRVFVCLVLWTKWGFRQYSALHWMLSKSLTCLWRGKNGKWRTLSDGKNHTVQWVRKCPPCSLQGLLSLGQ